jgi:hypothetical protein
MDELIALKNNINMYINGEIDYQQLCGLHHILDDQCFHFFIKGKNKFQWCQNKRIVNDRLICCPKHIKSRLIRDY